MQLKTGVITYQEIPQNLQVNGFLKHCTLPIIMFNLNETS